jgi:hypothetical protein
MGENFAESGHPVTSELFIIVVGNLTIRFFFLPVDSHSPETDSIKH